MKRFPTGSFWWNSGSDYSAEVICFPNVMFRANLAINEIHAVVCAARHDAQYCVGKTHNRANKTVRVDVVLAQRASGV